MKIRKSFLLISLIFIFIILISATASAKEVTVDDDSGADFVSIQEAVTNSVTGDIIIVRPGTYTGNILVNITGLTIRSESKNSDVQVKPLDDSESTFLIEANNITISGLNITGASKDSDKYAIFIYGKMNNVTGNTIENGSIFLGSYMPSNLTIIFHGDMNNVTGNTIENGSIILGSEISDNLIAENKISNGGGIHVSCCGRNNVVSGNKISNCSTGIYAYDQAVDICNNRITSCKRGIHLSSVSSKIGNNTILNCDLGIDLGDACLGVEIINNTIISSAECGIVDQYDEGGKRIYNNYFNNTVNVRLGAGRGNTWNSSLVSGTSIAGGPYIGGNFWAKPDGTGFSQICVDLDGNGIGDLPYKIYEDPYNIYEDEFDYLPLVSLSSPQNSATLTANFTASVTNGTAPLAVKFTDLSKNAFAWNWDFDGDGISDSKKQNPVYVYKTSGNYTVNLTASNGINTSSKLANITVEKRVSSTWPFVYITNNDAVSVIDTATGMVITKVKVGLYPSGVAVTPNGKTAYVANSGSNTVSVIDTSTNIVTATVDVGISPNGVAVNQVGTKVYVANKGYSYGGTVSVIDTSNNNVIATVNVGGGCGEIAVNPMGTKVYLAHSWNDDISVIDTATNAVTDNFSVRRDYNNFAFSPDGTKLYVAITDYDAVDVIDTATNTVTATVDVDNYPLEVVVNPAGTKVYVANGEGLVSVIDTATRKVITTVNVGGWPYGIAVTRDGKKVYVVNRDSSGSNTISVIDTSNDTVSATVNIEVSPGEIAIIPEPESVFPVANFSSNVSEGFAPLAVKFNDSSENATEWNWDFGDGENSTEQNPTHTYFAEGTYNVNLVVSTANGISSKLATITVQSQRSSSGGSSSSGSGSSGGSSSSGGGGAGGSPELQSNVAAKEISQTFITSGSAVKFSFPQKTTPVLYLSFDSKKTAGKTTTIVEMLKGKSTLVTGLPSGEVYKYLNIWVGNSGFGDSNNIANAVINFKVEKSWIQDKNIDKSSITLNRCTDNKWNRLSTNLSGEDDKYLYFTAKTPGFSPFAINGKTTATWTTVQPATGNKSPSEVDDTQNNAGNTTSNIDQTAERTQSSNTSGKEDAKMPDFEIASGIVCLLSVFLTKEDKKRIL